MPSQMPPQNQPGYNKFIHAIFAKHSGGINRQELFFHLQHHITLAIRDNHKETNSTE